MSQLTSSSFHAWSPVPPEMMAFPPIQRLPESIKTLLENTPATELTSQFFPAFQIGFPISADFAPLADPDIEGASSINTREYNERTLNAPNGYLVEVAAGATDQISTASPVAFMALGWVPSVVGPNSSLSHLDVHGDQNDYWEGKIWKYERAFFVTDQSFWETEHATYNGSPAQIDPQENLYELATKIDSSANPVITSTQIPAIVRYFVPQPQTQPSAFTTKQVDSIGFQNLQYRGSPDFFISQNSTFEPISVSSNVANWAKSYHTKYPTGSIPSFSPFQYIKYYTAHYWTGAVNSMAASAVEWSNRVPAIGDAASKWNLAQKGAFFDLNGCAFRPMYEHMAQRSVPSVYQSRSAYAFGDFHGLAYAAIASNVFGTYVPMWSSLCKIQRVKHYMKIRLGQLVEFLGQDYELVGPEEVRLSPQQLYRPMSRAESDVLCVAIFTATQTNGAPTQNNRFAQGLHCQIIGFTPEQAKECFPEYITVGGDSTAGFGLFDANQFYRFCAKYSEYTVTQSFRNSNPPVTTTQTYSGFFPFEGTDYLGYYATNNPGGFGVRLKNTGTQYVVDEILSTYVFSAPGATNENADGTETWVPTEAAWNAWAQGLAQKFADYFTGLMDVSDCGSFEVLSSDGTVVMDKALYGIPQIGTLRIRWTPVDSIP